MKQYQNTVSEVKGSTCAEGIAIHETISLFMPFAPVVGAFYFSRKKRRFFMESHVSLIGIIVENTDSTDKLNDLLHEYGKFIIGRMGLPYPKKNVNVISIALDAPTDVINTLAGKIGMLDGISSKVVCSAK